MASVNKVILVGNVGSDPEVKYLGESTAQGGSSKVATLRLATSEKYRDRNGNMQELTEWHNIVAWRNSADVIEKYVKKGSQIFIEGRLRTRQWTDQGGNKRYTTEIMVDNLQLLGRKPEQEGGYQAPAPAQQAAPVYQRPAPQPAQPVQAAAPAPSTDGGDDDFPF